MIADTTPATAFQAVIRSALTQLALVRRLRPVEGSRGFGKQIALAPTYRGRDQAVSVTEPPMILGGTMGTWEENFRREQEEDDRRYQQQHSEIDRTRKFFRPGGVSTVRPYTSRQTLRWS